MIDGVPGGALGGTAHRARAAPLSAAGLLRAAAERRLFAIGHEIADLYEPSRPQPLAAKWAADEG